MLEYFRRSWQSAVVIWVTLTVGILVSSIIYTSLNVVGVSQDASLLIAFAALIMLVILSFLFFPITLLNQDGQSTLSFFRSLFSKKKENASFYYTPTQERL